MYARFLMIILTFILPVHAAVIICDLGYTVVAPNTGAARSHIGFMNAVHCYFDFKHTYAGGRNEFKEFMQTFYTKTLNEIPSPAHNRNLNLLLPDGSPMPAILQDFMTGTITSQQALMAIEAWTQQHPEHFMNDNHRTVFVRIAEFNFSEDLFIESLRLLPCAQLLRACAQTCDEQGNRKNTCVILSNWAREHVEPFKQKFAHTLMPYIDACIFSCDGHGPKPLSSIYQHCETVVKRRFPEKTEQLWIVIDDQPEHNAAAIQNLNRTVVSCHPDQAKQILTNCHVIDTK